jgi:phosphate transport system substrate-binding protein
MAGPAATETVSRVDPALLRYTPVDGLSGTLIAAGSDTMLVLQTLMAEAFREVYPQVRVEIEGKGSATAPPALTESSVNIANMSRRILSAEEAGFQERFGYAPLRVDVALDTVGVFVHRDNPIASFTLSQIDAIFSATRSCGESEAITVWGQLGLGGQFATAPISLFGRNAASGTYAYFKRHALCRGDFKSTVKEQPGSASVVQGVARDPYGIGYSGIGYATPGVRAVPILVDETDPPIEATFANAANGRYPFARFLEVYINKPPGSAVDRLTFEYLRFMLSADGQHVVIRAGFHPLDAATAARQLDKLAR